MYPRQQMTPGRICTGSSDFGADPAQSCLLSGMAYVAYCFINMFIELLYKSSITQSCRFEFFRMKAEWIVDQNAKTLRLVFDLFEMKTFCILIWNEFILSSLVYMIICSEFLCVMLCACECVYIDVHAIDLGPQERIGCPVNIAEILLRCLFFVSVKVRYFEKKR